MHIGGDRHIGKGPRVDRAAVGQYARHREGVFGDDVVHEGRPSAHGDDLQVGRPAGAQEVLKGGKVARRVVRVAVHRTDDVGSCLVLREVLRHSQFLDELLRLLRAQYFVGVNQIRRHIARAAVLDGGCAGSIQRSDDRVFNRSAGGDGQA